MKNMKVGIVFVGKIYTRTPDERKVKDHELRDCDKLNNVTDEAFRNMLSERVRSLMPAGIDTFTCEVETENDAIDVPEADAYVLIPFTAIDKVFVVVHSKNRHIVVYTPPFEEFWSYGNVFYPYFLRDCRKIDAYLGIDPDTYLSENDADFTAHMEALTVRHRIRNTRVLCVGEAMYEPYHSFNWGYEVIRLIQEKFGLKWFHMGSASFLKFFESCSDSSGGTVRALAKDDRLPADFSDANCVKAYNVYKKLIEKYGATAFTVNCLESIVHTSCHTTSCFALSMLNDEGIISACEADATTLIDMLITSYASNAPSFMLNPYLFPADNKLFVSHCTSPRKHSFANDEKDDFNTYAYFEIRSLPCGLQVLKQPGPVTVTGISHDKLDKMVIVRGNLVRNTAFPSCRTQVEIDVPGGIKKLADCYEGRHWALVYGDQSEKISRANTLLGIESIII
ncbi:MAG: hypothetical protein IKY07_09610 [Clostridia bacterium]|nr:hypothetical protein [Clostridia bacterium]MBR5007335.1 hypothetical protein [Clostridia bacterium]